MTRKQKIEPIISIPDGVDPFEFLVNHTNILKFKTIEYLREELETFDPIQYYGDGILIGTTKRKAPKKDSGLPKRSRSFKHELIASKLSILVNLYYQDSKGHDTIRNVLIDSLVKSEYGDLYIHGLCHLTNETRNFRFDRIKKVTLIESGEILSTDQLISLLKNTSKGTA